MTNGEHTKVRMMNDIARSLFEANLTDDARRKDMIWCKTHAYIGMKDWRSKRLCTEMILWALELEIQINIFSSASDDDRERWVLNRVIRAKKDGWGYEPDQRHAHITVETTGLKDSKRVMRWNGQYWGVRRGNDHKAQNHICKRKPLMGWSARHHV